MDTDSIVDYSRARFEHAAARRVLREKYEAKLIFGYRGGMFRTDPSMIVFLDLFKETNVVVKDLYDHPINVDATELKDLMISRWHEIMNAWLQEYTETQKQR
jgi:hypothetical protein